MRTIPYLLLATVLACFASGCAGMAPRIYSPVHTDGGAGERGDHAREIEALATELADRAESRSPLGNARIRVGVLDAIEPRRSPYRQVSILERDLRATEATVRHELGMSLGNRVNIVGDSAELATHRIEGEFLRSAADLELSLRLVEIKSDWIVATARRRIENFVPEYYDRRLQSVEPTMPASGPSQLAPATASPKREDPSSARSKARALRPAFPKPDASTDSAMANAQSVPVPTTVLTTGERQQNSKSAEAVRPRTASADRIAAKRSPETAPMDASSSIPPAGERIEFDSGPAAARLRANGTLPEPARPAASAERPQ